ncbi:MAG TPA: hypothetical protein VI454_03900 [Verrucomicrobiae bacterium]
MKTNVWPGWWLLSAAVAISILGGLVAGTSRETLPSGSGELAAATELSAQPVLAADSEVKPGAGPAVVSAAAAEVPFPAAVATAPHLPEPGYLTRAMEDVLKLSQSGIGEELLTTYVESLRSASFPSPDEIAYLHDRGVPDRVIATIVRKASKPDDTVSTPPGPAPATTYTVPPVPATVINNYVEPAPVYVQPAPVCVPPAPAYFAPTVVSFGSHYGGWFGGHRPGYYGSYGSRYNYYGRSYGSFGIGFNTAPSFGYPSRVNYGYGRICL